MKSSSSLLLLKATLFLRFPFAYKATRIGLRISGLKLEGGQEDPSAKSGSQLPQPGLSSSPALEERGDGFRASVFKLFLALGIEEFAVGVQHGKSRYTLADRYMVLVRDAQVMVDLADVDMNHDVVLGKEFGIGCLMVVEVQHLAIPAPVAAKIQNYTFVVVTGDFLGGLNVRSSISAFGVQTLVHMKGGLSHG